MDFHPLSPIFPPILIPYLPFTAPAEEDGDFGQVWRDVAGQDSGDDRQGQRQSQTRRRTHRQNVDAHQGRDRGREEADGVRRRRGKT